MKLNSARSPSGGFLLFLWLLQCFLLYVKVFCSLAQLVGDGSESNAAANGGGWSLNEDSWNYWWSYSGVSGPAYWGLLNPEDWFLCDKGRRQSPINIETHSLVYDPHLTPLRVDNNLVSGLLYNDGHALVFNCTIPINFYSSKLAQTELIYDDQLMQNNTKNYNSHANNQLVSNLKRSIGEKQDFLEKQYHDASHLPLTHDSLDSRADSLIDALGNYNPLARSSGFDLTRESADEMKMSNLIGESGLLGLQEKNNIETSQGDSNTAAAAINSFIDLSSNQNEQQNDDEDMIPRLDQIEFSGAGLPYTYRFETLTLRFGFDSKLGSEHQINSQSYAAELQLMAYNSMLYKSYSSASTKPYGLLGISILVDVLQQEQETPLDDKAPSASSVVESEKTIKQNSRTKLRANDQLELLLSNLDEVKHRGGSTKVRNLNLTALLPETNYFVTYEGSLTTPGCHESVTWLLLNKPLYISQSKLNILRTVSASEPLNTPTGNLIAGNIRFNQSVNDRPIRTNIRPNSQSEGQETCQRLWTRYEYRKK